MSEVSLRDVQARTEELGRLLHARTQEFRPSLGQRLQDRLMLILMEEAGFRNRMLRFVDVLAALPRDPLGRRTAALFREYVRGDFPRLPWALRGALRAGRAPLVPSPLLAWAARAATAQMAGRFIVHPGPHSMQRALAVLQKSGRHPSFDLLGEDILSDEEARQYQQGYLDMIARLGSHPWTCQRTGGGGPCMEVSLKLSSLTSQFNPADPVGTLRRIRPALEAIFQAARAQGLGVTIDAEQYVYRDLVWHVVREVLAPGGPLGDWPDAGVVVQAYLRDAEQHASEVMAFARRRGAPIRVRLVKGAYWDYEAIVAEQNGWPVPVHMGKGNTDVAFQRLVRLFLESGAPVRLAVGSHNLRAHAYAEALRESLGHPQGAIEHQTLYRTTESLSRALPRMGWVTRDYIPVGQMIPGMGYLVRRVLENTSQAGFLTRARLHEDLSKLLRPPEPSVEESPYARPSHPTGFANTPPARLFDATERRRFQEALENTRARWGATYRLLLGEEAVETAARLPSLCPSDPDPSRPVGWVHLAGEPEARRAIAIANGAAPRWAGTPLEERAALGLRAADILQSRRDEVAAWVVHEAGRTWVEALADVEEAMDHIRWNAFQLRRLGPVLAAYRPRGVVACIPPWNFPTALPAGMASAALLAGNTVILKSAEQTPIIAHLLVQAFHDAGVPKEALVHLPGRGETAGAALVESPDVDMVAFTGSRDVGVHIYQTAASVKPAKGGVKRVVAEMGGKNAIVVFPDADMDEAVMGIVRSAFSHAGQKCSACSRVIAHREVYDRLAERLAAAARSLPIGLADDPGTFINPVISAEARERIARYREIAAREGRVLLDRMMGEGRGCLLGPLVVGLDPGGAGASRLAHEEVFGPVLTVVPFESEQEAADLVNDSEYALTLGLFTRSPGTIRRMARACMAGNIYVNREIVGARVGVEPFGGFRLSGTGPKAGSEEYLLAFLTRREGFRIAPEQLGTTAPLAGPGATGPLASWQGTAAAVRLRSLSAAARALGGGPGPLDSAIAQWKGVSPSEASSLTARTLETIAAVLKLAPEVMEPQPTVAVPGQKNFVLWETPLGVGVAAVDEGADPWSLAGLVFAPLLAGNGVVVAASGAALPSARVLVDALRRAGVPRAVLALAPADAAPATLAAGRFHFAAVDLGLEATRAINSALGAWDAGAGRPWLKALISVADGPRPGEAGFLRLFAHPKLVAVRTLRHGADLELG